MAQNRYDLVVLDVNLPGFDGFEVLDRIRATRTPVRVLMLTARSEVGDRVAGLKAGADDYLTKPFAMEELLARVDVLGRRNVAAETEIVYRVGDLCMDTGKRRVNRGNKRIDLSPREFEVLQVFLREPGRTFSRDEICERIWEREHEYDTRTVEIFIMRLRKKIDRPGEESLIRTVRSVGYMVKAPCNPLFPALRSSHELSQRPSPQKQIPSSHFPLMRSGQAGGLIADMAK